MFNEYMRSCGLKAAWYVVSAWLERVAYLCLEAWTRPSHWD